MHGCDVLGPGPKYIEVFKEAAGDPVELVGSRPISPATNGGVCSDGAIAAPATDGGVSLGGEVAIPPTNCGPSPTGSIAVTPAGRGEVAANLISRPTTIPPKRE